MSNHQQGEPLFERLGIGMRLALFVGIVLTFPLWFPLWVIDELKKDC